jgi:hypothetical protein
MSWKTVTTRYDFNGDAVPTSQNVVIVGAAPPTATVTGGRMVMALTAADQAQVVCWNLGNAVIPFLITQLLRVRFLLRMDVALTTAEGSVHWGIGSARVDDTIAGIVAHTAYGIVGANNNVIVRSQDGVNTLGATATGETLAVADGTKKFSMNLAEGMAAAEPPAPQQGGRARIILGIDNPFGEHRVINGQLGAAIADMSGYALGVMPFVQIQKTAGVGVGTVSVESIELDHIVRA